MANPYIYRPLPTDFVRLVRLNPDSTAKNIQCELASFPLHDAPNFNALSYCWGDPTRSASIQCNGYTLTTTPVIIEVMQRLPVVDREGVEWLWIDQICIDQANVAERGRQVDMMKLIYKTSERTIIWLGAGILGIKSLGILLEKMAYLCAKDLSSNGNRERRRYTLEEYEATSLPSFDDPSWNALGDVLSRPWFTRSWVIQEAVFSKVSPRMLCGSHELSWRHLVYSGAWLGSLCYKLTPLSQKPTITVTLRSLKLFYELLQVGLPWDITTLLNKTIRFQASEPRDRIYSLIGLTGESIGPAMLPQELRGNYVKPVRQIFRDVTRYIIKTSGNLSILTLIRGDPDWNRFPSWVVDFSADVLGDRISYFAWSNHTERCHTVREVSNRAAAGLPVDVQPSPSEDVFALKGFQIDTITAMTGMMTNSSLNAFGAEVLSAWKMASLHLVNRYATTEAIARAIMVTLTADWNLTNFERVADQPLDHFWAYIHRAHHNLLQSKILTKDQEDIIAGYSTLLPSLEPGIAAEANIYRLHLDAAHRRRVFFTRDMTYVGLGPGIMEENDILCILFGAATPVVLRRDGDFYRFVGECYVYDLMHGEAIEDLHQGKHTVETFHLA